MNIIYKILNHINGKFYIGSSINYVRRWQDHEYLLNVNKHHSKHLQAAWNKYGAENFEFRALEIVQDDNKLIEREQYWIDETNCCDDAIGYNLRATDIFNLA